MFHRYNLHWPVSVSLHPFCFLLMFSQKLLFPTRCIHFIEHNSFNAWLNSIYWRNNFILKLLKIYILLNQKFLFYLPFLCSERHDVGNVSITHTWDVPPKRMLRCALLWSWTNLESQRSRVITSVLSKVFSAPKCETPQKQEFSRVYRHTNCNNQAVESAIGVHQ